MCAPKFREDNVAFNSERTLAPSIGNAGTPVLGAVASVCLVRQMESQLNRGVIGLYNLHFLLGNVRFAKRLTLLLE